MLRKYSGSPGAWRLLHHVTAKGCSLHLQYPSMYFLVLCLVLNYSSLRRHRERNWQFCSGFIYRYSPFAEVNHKSILKDSLLYYTSYYLFPVLHPSFRIQTGIGCFRNWMFSSTGQRAVKGEASAQLSADFLTCVPFALSMRSTAMYAVY